jgi:hypothetical protein
MRNYSLLFITLAFSILVFSSLYSFVNNDTNLFNSGVFTFGILASFGALCTALTVPSDKEKMELDRRFEDVYRDLHESIGFVKEDQKMYERDNDSAIERVYTTIDHIENRIDELQVKSTPKRKA